MTSKARITRDREKEDEESCGSGHREVAGGETDAPALLVMLAVAGLLVWDRRGRRTSQLSSTICSLLLLRCPNCSALSPLPWWAFLIPPLLLQHQVTRSPPQLQYNLSSLAILSALSSIKTRGVVNLRPGGSVPFLESEDDDPLLAWCSCSRLTSCPDQPPSPPLSLLPLPPTLSHSKTQQDTATSQHTHQQKESPAASEETRYRHSRCAAHRVQKISATHTTEDVKVRNRACCSGAVNVWWAKCWECAFNSTPQN